MVDLEEQAAMKKLVAAAGIALKVSLVILLPLLGLLFWTRHALSLLPLHMAAGLALVLALWTLAALGARRGVPGWLVAVAACWGVLVIALGVTQTRLLPSSFHWVVRVAHLLVGIGAVWLAERIGRQLAAFRRQVPA
jgi:hypothetical protein